MIRPRTRRHCWYRWSRTACIVRGRRQYFFLHPEKDCLNKDDGAGSPLKQLAAGWDDPSMVYAGWLCRCAIGGRRSDVE